MGIWVCVDGYRMGIDGHISPPRFENFFTEKKLAFGQDKQETLCAMI